MTQGGKKAGRARRDAVMACCAELPGTAEEYPFGDGVTVFKVRGKVFALIPVDWAESPSISLKCDPARAVALRERHPAVTPGYHLNKRHWNTVTLDGSVPADEVAEWIEHSYDLVAAGLPRAERDRLANLALAVEQPERRPVQ